VDLVWNGRAILAVGPQAGAGRHPVDPRLPSVGVRLKIGAAGLALGCAASELSPAGTPLAGLWGRAAETWQRRLCDAGTPIEQTGLLLGLLAGHAADAPGPDEAVAEAVRLLNSGQYSVAETAVHLGLSGQQLHRRFLTHAGCGPRTMGRILRFRRFMGLAAAVAAGQTTLALAATAAGYADQAHLTRECRALSGSTPRGLVGALAEERSIRARRGAAGSPHGSSSLRPPGRPGR
jgi:AraC-like DNA-binding protein